MEKELKKDKGKPTFKLALGYFPTAISCVDQVSRFGAKKYRPFGWIDWVENFEEARDRYQEGLNRHLMAKYNREEVDPESGLPHSYHIAWNALAILELETIMENKNGT